MTINEHAANFAGKPVKEYDPGKGLQDAEMYHFKIGYGFDNYDAEEPLARVIEKFSDEPDAALVTGIVIGAWENMPEGRPSDESVKALADAKDKLTHLNAIFIADVIYEESEISWIQQSDMSPLFQAYPALTHFRVRGGQNLSLGELNHQELKSLIVESGGLDRSVVDQVIKAQLPELEHLELWLGTDDYGGDATIDDIKPILHQNPFPKLKYLGLRDSVIIDQIALELAQSPIMEQVKSIDLSLGTLSDIGGEALLNCPAIKSLAQLDLHHHFLSNEIMAKLKSVGNHVNIDDQLEDDDGYRYPAVSE